MNFTAHQVSTAKVFCETFLLSITSEKIVKKMPVNYHYAETVDMIYELVNLKGAGYKNITSCEQAFNGSCSPWHSLWRFPEIKPSIEQIKWRNSSQ